MTQDVTYVNLTKQETLEGKNEVIQFFTDQSKSDLKLTIDTIVFKEAETAVEKGTAQILYEDGSKEQFVFKALFVKESGKWGLKKIIEQNFEPASSHFEQLKEFDWLIGNWLDEDENVSINLSYQWDNNKNFLIQHFTSKILDQKELEGQQIIGWDPSQKTIRSWLFDSDGGFGEGTWTSDKDSWYSRMSYTLSDGRKASATYVYTKVDKNTYTFASASRDVNGELLPNIGPYKIVRQREEKQ